MELKKVVNPGDVIVWKWDKDFNHGLGDIFGLLVSAFGELTHVAIVYDMLEDNKARIFEAGQEGIQMKNIDINRTDIAILKPVDPFDREKIQFIIRNYYQRLKDEKNVDYDFEELALACIRKFRADTWLLSGINEIIKAIKGKDGKVCSELIAEILNLYYFNDPEKTNTDWVTPSNIYSDSRFKVYKPFDVILQT